MPRFKHYRHEATIPCPYQSPKVRVIWIDTERHEELYKTEQEAEERANILRAKGINPLVCSF
jgi:hypothetical protein